MAAKQVIDGMICPGCNVAFGVKFNKNGLGAMVNHECFVKDGKIWCRDKRKNQEAGEEVSGLMSITKALMNLCAQIRVLGAEPKHRGEIGTLTLRRTAYYMLARELTEMSYPSNQFGPGDEMKCMVHNGHWVTIKPEPVGGESERK